MFQVKTETETKNVTSKESSNTHATYYENDLSPDLRRNKMDPDFQGTRSYRKERDALCAIGIVLILLNHCITPLNMTLLMELINDGSLSRKVKLILMFWF